MAHSPAATNAWDGSCSSTGPASQSRCCTLQESSQAGASFPDQHRQRGAASTAAAAAAAAAPTATASPHMMQMTAAHSAPSNSSTTQLWARCPRPCWPTLQQAGTTGGPQTQTHVLLTRAAAAAPTRPPGRQRCRSQCLSGGPQLAAAHRALQQQGRGPCWTSNSLRWTAHCSPCRQLLRQAPGSHSLLGPRPLATHAACSSREARSAMWLRPLPPALLAVTSMAHLWPTAAPASSTLPRLGVPSIRAHQRWTLRQQQQQPLLASASRSAQLEVSKQRNGSSSQGA